MNSLLFKEKMELNVLDESLGIQYLYASRIIYTLKLN